jgi:hypothetical protein
MCFAAYPTLAATASAYDALSTLHGSPAPSPSTAAPLSSTIGSCSFSSSLGITPFANANNPATYNAFI